MLLDKSKIIISHMTLDDLNEISNILESEFDDFWNYNILKDELNSQNSTYLVAKLDNDIIGFAGFKAVFSSAELMNIVVRKTFRCNGIATLLMEELLKDLKNKKIATLYLEVAKNNTTAINLYKKFGFLESGVRKGYYQTDDAILMELHILVD